MGQAAHQPIAGHLHALDHRHQDQHRAKHDFIIKPLIADGEQKDQRHSPEVQKADLTNLIIDKAQMGLGCVNSWGALPLPQYMLPYGDYEFTFILTPVKHQIEIE